MPRPKLLTRRQRIDVTLAPDVLQKLQLLADVRHGGNKSALIEQLIRSAYQQHAAEKERT